MSKHYQKVFAAVAIGILSACGGGGDSGSNIIAPTLSADQAIFESEFLSPSLSYSPSWNLPNSGAPVDGTNYLYSYPSSISASPLTNGSQAIVSGSASTWSSTLTIPASTPTRYLVGGQIFTSVSGIQKFSYSGTGIESDVYASNGPFVVSCGSCIGK
jgi:hypothetical protein